MNPVCPSRKQEKEGFYHEGREDHEVQINIYSVHLLLRAI